MTVGLKWTKIALVSLIVSLFASCGPQALQRHATISDKSFSSPQDFAHQEILEIYAKKRRELVRLPDQERLLGASAELHDASLRIKSLEAARNAGMTFDASFLEHLRSVHVPALEATLTQKGLTADEAELQPDHHRAQGQLDDLTKKLEAAIKAAEKKTKDSKILRSLFELLAFSRSETLGDGRIGDWNPASSDQIQGSAIRGLLWVLETIDQRPSEQSITYEDLMAWHRALLGSAGHSFSFGGRVNDIYFANEQGQKEHVSLFVRRWLDKVNTSSGGILESINLYGEFLHMHPFGDSNGRMAEVGKVLLTSKVGLLPLITREKTSVENYLFQPLYGNGDLAQEAIAQANETLAVHQAIRDILGGQPLTGVELIGSNVVFSSATTIFVLNRTYFVDPSLTGLPPVRGAAVVLDTQEARDSYRLRMTFNNFATVQDIAPSVLVPTARLGRLKLGYPIFAVKKKDLPQGVPMTFQFLYKHPQSGDVIFHNNGQNYELPKPERLAIQ
jgi:hypothetical protein